MKLHVSYLFFLIATFCGCGSKLSEQSTMTTTIDCNWYLQNNAIELWEEHLDNVLGIDGKVRYTDTLLNSLLGFNVAESRPTQNPIFTQNQFFYGNGRDTKSQHLYFEHTPTKNLKKTDTVILRKELQLKDSLGKPLYKFKFEFFFRCYEYQNANTAILEKIVFEHPQANQTIGYPSLKYKYTVEDSSDQIVSLVRISIPFFPKHKEKDVHASTPLTMEFKNLKINASKNIVFGNSDSEIVELIQMQMKAHDSLLENFKIELK